MKAIVSGAFQERNVQIRTQLEHLAEPAFRQFTEKLLPGTEYSGRAAASFAENGKRTCEGRLENVSLQRL